MGSTFGRREHSFPPRIEAAMRELRGAGMLDQRHDNVLNRGSQRRENLRASQLFQDVTFEYPRETSLSNFGARVMSCSEAYDALIHKHGSQAKDDLGGAKGAPPYAAFSSDRAMQRDLSERVVDPTLREPPQHVGWGTLRLFNEAREFSEPF